METTTKVNVCVWAWLLWLALLPAHAFYDPGAQRWLNRDPIAERGGINLHSFVLNSPADRFDPDGRIAFPETPEVEECSEAEWVRVNQSCKKHHGEWWVAISCVKVTGRFSITLCGGKIILKLPVLMYICLDTGPSPPLVSPLR